MNKIYTLRTLSINTWKFPVAYAFFATFFAAIVGCTNSSNSGSTEPVEVDENSQVVAIGDYQFILPKKFERVELKAEKPDGLEIEVYRMQVEEGTLPTVVNASITSDELALKNAQASPRESVTHFNVGVANASGVKVDKREESKRLEINGLELLGFFWTGTNQEGKPAHGLAFGGIDEAKTISFGTIAFKEISQESRAEMMKYLTSLRRSN